MPYEPPKILSDVDKNQRQKLQKLLYEKSVYGCTFSYDKLLKVIGDPDTIQSCVVAATKEQADNLRDDVNDRISSIFSQHDIKTLRDYNPFGQACDYVYYETSSPPHINRAKAIETAVRFGVKSSLIEKILDMATSKTTYTTLQCRPVRVKGEKK